MGSGMIDMVIGVNSDDRISMTIREDGEMVSSILLPPELARRYARLLLANADIVDPQDDELVKTPDQINTAGK